MSGQVGLNSAQLLGPMLPVTGSFALPFAAYLTVLSGRVVSKRIGSKTLLGNNSSPGNSADPLFLATRAHENFIENVPIALVFAALAELNGGNRKYLTGALSALLTFRVLHAELGMIQAGQGVGRPIGFFGSLSVVTGLAGYAAYLAKGYWGF